jgi:lysyl-tRNA synthetase class 1
MIIMEEKSLFWADQLADRIVNREKFHYTDEKVPKLEKFVVKSAASVSGVLHIGRLSDTIRCDAVFRALKDLGVKSEFIWTADNVDPLRKIPKGVPANFDKYIGMPVTDIPDPWGCHGSYEEHHKSSYMEVINQFIHDRMKTYSMREEYLKGSFKKEITLILKSYLEIVEIQNRYRDKDRKLRADWSPWQPICEKCGKIITTRVTAMREDGLVEYECSDYDFKTTKATGCGHRGVDDPMKGNGKLMYKSELAAQWAHWKVCTEGFGKEYQVPGSAFWINGEIIERILHFPMAEPIFYEHLIIDNVKMSASLGNIVYPKDWLTVATPELLRFFYNKKLMKTRSFSWKDLPVLFEDYDNHERVYFGKAHVENKKEEEHMKRLFGISQRNKPVASPIIPFDYAVMVSQIVPEKTFLDYAVSILKKTGHIPKDLSKAELEKVKERLFLAREWAKAHAPEQYRFEVQESVPDSVKEKLSDKQRLALRKLAAYLHGKEMDEEQLTQILYKICKEEVGIETKDFFRAAYMILINKEFGPRLARFILAIGRDRVAGILNCL